MKNVDYKQFAKASLIRAIRTCAQTAIATIGVSAVMSDVDWLMVGSASLLSGILSLLTSVATGLPEVPEEQKLTVDEQSGLEIRKTDNTLKDCDHEAPQDARPLTQEQIAEIIRTAGENDGDA